MPALASLTTFVAGQVAQASQVNGNFAALRTWADSSVVMTDVAKTITASHTFSAAQTFSGGITSGATVTASGSNAIFSVTRTSSSVATIALCAQDTQVRLIGYSTANDKDILFDTDNAGTTRMRIAGATGLVTISNGATITAGGLTVSAGGATITGNSTITGTLGGLTGLTVASGGANITGNSTVTGNLTITGTFSATNAPAQFARRTSDVTFTGSTDVSLSVAVGASEVWEIEWVLFHTNATGTATMTATVSGPVSGVINLCALGAENGSTTVVGAVATGTASVGVASIPMDATGAMTRVNCIYVGGANAGTLSLGLLASSGTGTLKTGSYARYTKIA